MQEAVDATVVEEEEVPATSVEVARVEPPNTGVTLFGTTNPQEVMQAASAVATVLVDVLKKQGLTTNISGRAHVRVEGWQTVGSMLGVFPVLEEVHELPWPEPVPEKLQKAQAKGQRFGYVARYRAQRQDGAVVGGGEAECSRTEGMWSGRDDYALKSMAQTRATSKALKAPLGFVVALAGYATTPAEEMPSQEGDPSVRGQEPFGRQASPDSVAGAARAASYLGVPAGSATELFKALTKDARGYMPELTTKAIMRVAATVKAAREAEAEEPVQESQPEPPQQDQDQPQLGLDAPPEPHPNPGGYPD